MDSSAPFSGGVQLPALIFFSSGARNSVPHPDRRADGGVRGKFAHVAVVTGAVHAAPPATICGVGLSTLAEHVGAGIDQRHRRGALLTGSFRAPV